MRHRWGASFCMSPSHNQPCVRSQSITWLQPVAERDEPTALLLFLLLPLHLSTFLLCYPQRHRISSSYVKYDKSSQAHLLTDLFVQIVRNLSVLIPQTLKLNLSISNFQGKSLKLEFDIGYKMVAVLFKCTLCTFLALKSQSRSSNFSQNFNKAVKFPKTILFRIFLYPKLL